MTKFLRSSSLVLGTFFIDAVSTAFADAPAAAAVVQLDKVDVTGSADALAARP